MYRILVVADAITASTHTAVLQPFDLLARQGRIHYKLVTTDGSIEPWDVLNHDLVVVQRSVNPLALNLMAWARKYGKGFIYDLDDNFLAIDESDHPPGGHYNRLVVKQVVAQLIKGANLIRAGSSQLAQALVSLNGRVEFRRNSVDLALINSLGPRPQGPAPLVVGYSGTAKATDFQPIIPALMRLLNEYPSAMRLDFMGYVPVELVGHPAVSFVPYDFDYRQYLRTWWSRGWHIGLAPLRDSRFNCCKTDIKFREYGALGVVGIYSDLPNYREVIQEGISGLLVPNDPHHWYVAIKRLLDDPALRQRIVHHARHAVEQQHSVEKVALEWLEVFSRVV
ncbi:MAG: glycosyltransferase [Thermincolia bacterium]